MVECIECGKKLGFLEGYCHPTMGKKHHLCSPCFDQVSDSVEKWREFVMSNSFNANTKQMNIQMYWKKILPSCSKINKVLNNFKIEKEICMKD